MLRLFLQRPSRNETLAHACTMKCAIHKTNICNKIKQFCTVYSMYNKPEQKCAKQKQKMCKIQKCICTTQMCKIMNNTLRKKEQYFVIQNNTVCNKAAI